MRQTITTLIATSTLGLTVAMGASSIGSSPASAQDGCGCSCYTYTSSPANVTRLCEDDPSVLIRKLSAKGVKVNRKEIVCSREVYVECTGGGGERKRIDERGRRELKVEKFEETSGGNGGGGGGGGGR